MKSGAVPDRCPDWRQLTAARQSGEEPDAWPQARRHLRECAACRAGALQLDPTLLFQLLPEPMTAAEEVSEMRQRVANSRRDRAASARLATGRRKRWLPAAAAAVVLALLVPSSESRLSGPPPQGSYTMPAVVQAAVEQLPLVEAIDGAITPLFEWSGPELSIVLLAGERQDV